MANLALSPPKVVFPSPDITHPSIISKPAIRARNSTSTLTPALPKLQPSLRIAKAAKPRPEPQQENSPPSLNTLIRPAHILSLFRQHEERQTYYFEEYTQLWDDILMNPQRSPVYQQAYQKLILLTGTGKDALVRHKEREAKLEEERGASLEAEREAKLEADRLSRERMLVPPKQDQQLGREQATFETLMRRISGAAPIPSGADFEKCLSAFKYTGWEKFVSEQERKATQQDIETAFALLGANKKDKSVEDTYEGYYAGLTLFRLMACRRIDEYLDTGPRERGGCLCGVDAAECDMVRETWKLKIGRVQERTEGELSTQK